MKTLIIAVLLLPGCSRYAQVQIDLLRHIESGIIETSNSVDENSQLVAQLYNTRRTQLDAAFDRDVIQRPSLDANWVIEHRKAYAVALDALHEAHAKREAASDVDRRNLQAMQRAVERVIWMQSLQSKWFNPIEEIIREQD